MPPEKRIAVIAVHGVADQKPGDSQAAIAALMLSSTDANSQPLYKSFDKRSISVPLQPAYAKAVAADIAQAGDEADEFTKWRSRFRRFFGGFSESPVGYRRFLEEQFQEPKTSTDGPQPRTPRRGRDVGLAYMRMLLAPYKPKIGARSYSTDRLEGRRSDAGGVSARSVDVYEVYWADLSTVGKDPFRFFSSLYQLVLHLSELGRRALEDGLAEFSNYRRWRWLVWLQAVSVRQLAVPIPIINLLLLVTLLGAVFVRVLGGSITDQGAPNGDITNTWGVRIAAVIAAAAMGIGLAYRIAAPPARPKLRDWWPLPAVAAMIGAAVGVGSIGLLGRADLVLVTEWWLIGFVLCDLILQKYEKVRPGARNFGRVTYTLAGMLFLWSLGFAFQHGGPIKARAIEYAAFWSMQVQFVALSIMWILLILSAFVAWVSGSVIVKGYKDDHRARASAAVRTSRLSLAISASAMLALIILVWSGLMAWGLKSVNVFECMQVVMFPPLDGADWILSDPQSLGRWLGDLPGTRACIGVPNPVHDYFRAVLLMSTTSGLPVMLLLVGLSMLILIWMALPSVRLESEAPSTCTNEQSERVGSWLSRGLDATRIVTGLWWAAVFIVLVIFEAGDNAARHGRELYPVFDWLFRVSKTLTLPILQTTGALIAASAAVIVFSIAKFAGSGLDVMLDVDNYLRELPSEHTPRARIAERYVSLLRAIAKDRSPDGRPYDSVIIVAHSLGALISTDLLRYLNSESEAARGDPALAAFGYGEKKSMATIPIRLFTMGNPIRQLLNRFFPHQYAWVRAAPDNAVKPVPPLPPNEAWAKNATPSTIRLGIAHWSNAYRSGDYVGRGLWLEEWFKRTDSADGNAGAYPEPIKVFWREGAEEMCIGLGAHTHYWNETAPDVRDHLNGLIASA